MAETGKTTIKSLEEIYSGFAPAEVFMSDGGKHFKNNEVWQCCKKWGGRHHVVAAYLPWVNGLVEGTNKILLCVLACLCMPEAGEDGWQTMNWAELLKKWPDYFDEAIQILNWRILLALKFSPKELLLSLIINTNPTPLKMSSSMPTPNDFNTHMVYTAQQCLDRYSKAMQHGRQGSTEKYWNLKEEKKYHKRTTSTSIPKQLSKNNQLRVQTSTNVVGTTQDH